MKYIKTYENLELFKKYLIIRYKSTEYYVAEFEEIKDYSSVDVYATIKIDKSCLIEENPSVETHPSAPIEFFKDKIVFQSDDLEEVKEYAKMLISAKNYNL